MTKSMWWTDTGTSSSPYTKSEAEKFAKKQLAKGYRVKILKKPRGMYEVIWSTYFPGGRIPAANLRKLRKYAINEDDNAAR